MEIYVVKPGDSVYKIAAAQGVPADTIIYNNQLEDPYPLAVGQALLLSKGESPQVKKAVETGGYAYPYINPDVLAQTLPYLSKLFVFSYGFTPNGDLIAPQSDDTFMIEMAVANQTAPVLTLTPFGPDGRFNNYLISQVTNNNAAQQNLIEQLVQTVQQKGFQGVDIDFEYILAQDRVAFAQFVANVRESINAIGYPVSVALAPKTADDQKGTLYEGKDYRLLGEAADNVLLMTYEWGYTYGPPMAVAPIHMVRQVVEYALTRIPAEKINLGIPNYGYDWTLPFEQGVSRARTVGNVQAVQIAIENNAQIQFDETAQSPFFRYYKDGKEHEVWFEDVRSMQAKFDLVDEFGLRGMGYWQIMRLFRANWLLLADRFWIRHM
ncbi:MAG: LysM peptidoglycan-binding domain-containing protein [Eubacterium sp.]|nr:LysM peptidoglycan-binding domain-containing protein [Eubacterium sp.]